MTPKEQFIADTKLASWWAEIVNSSNYDKLMLHVDGIALESLQTMDQRDGMIFIKQTLKTINQTDTVNRLPRTGLQYDIKVKPKGQ